MFKSLVKTNMDQVLEILWEIEDTKINRWLRIIRHYVICLCYIIVLYCIVLYSSIYIAPLNSHGQTEALLV